MNYDDWKLSNREDEQDQRLEKARGFGLMESHTCEECGEVFMDENIKQDSQGYWYCIYCKEIK